MEQQLQFLSHTLRTSTVIILKIEKWKKIFDSISLRNRQRCFIVVAYGKNLSAVSVLLFGENFELEKYTTFIIGEKINEGDELSTNFYSKNSVKTFNLLFRYVFYLENVIPFCSFFVHCFLRK